MADLLAYRAAVKDVLWKCDCNVDAMEKYASRDDLPREACEQDVYACNVYVGIFAWRYGSIPPEDNPEALSITEFEYRAACKAGKTRLIFILDDTFPWPPNLLDSQHPYGGSSILDLRARLKTERWAAIFTTPEDLANKVMVSLIQQRSTNRVEILSEFPSSPAYEFGPSYLPNIQGQISQPGLRFIALRLGPLPWWNTRLHLLCALESDFSELQQVVILDADGSFLVMTSPGETRRTLTNASVQLELIYNDCRRQAKNGGYGINSIIALYPQMVRETSNGQDEARVK